VANGQRQDEAYLAGLDEEERVAVLMARNEEVRINQAKDASRARFLKSFAPRRSLVAGSTPLREDGSSILSSSTPVRARRPRNPQRRYSAPGLGLSVEDIADFSGQ